MQAGPGRAGAGRAGAGRADAGRAWQGCLLAGSKRPALWVLCTELGQSIKCPRQVWAVLIKLQRALR